MRLLLDTHILLWALMGDRRLPKGLVPLIRSGENDVAVSAVSIWEITIKAMKGLIQIDLRELRMAMDQVNFTELPLRFAHAMTLRDLPQLHRDPFDRILIAQALADRRRLVTKDEEILRYKGFREFDPLTA